MLAIKFKVFYTLPYTYLITLSRRRPTLFRPTELQKLEPVAMSEVVQLPFPAGGDLRRSTRHFTERMIVP